MTPGTRRTRAGRPVAPRTSPGGTAAARPGEPPARRRSRHAPPLGGRGPRPRVHDARRAPPVRAAGPGAARRHAPHRRHRRPRRRRRLDRPPERRLPPAVRRDPRRRPRAPGHRARGQTATRSATRAGASPRRWCATSTAPGPRATTPRPRPSTSRRCSGSGCAGRGSRSGPASRCSSRPGGRSSPSCGSSPVGSGVNAVAVGQLYDASTGLLDRLLLVFVEAHANAIVDDDDGPGGERMSPALLPALTSILAAVFAVMLLDQWRDRRHGFQLVWAFGMLCYAHRGRRRGGRGRRRLERGHLPRVVPDRRDLDGRLARASARRSCSGRTRFGYTYAVLLLFGAFITFIIRNSPELRRAPGCCRSCTCSAGSSCRSRSASRRTSSTRAGPGSRAAR